MPVATVFKLKLIDPNAVCMAALLSHTCPFPSQYSVHLETNQIASLAAKSGREAHSHFSLSPCRTAGSMELHTYDRVRAHRSAGIPEVFPLHAAHPLVLLVLLLLLTHAAHHPLPSLS